VVNIKCMACSHFRGKGDYFRLGHGSDGHVRRPQLVEGLKGKKIVHIAVGALHCLAVTDTGQVSSSKSSLSCYLAGVFLTLLFHVIKSNVMFTW